MFVHYVDDSPTDAMLLKRAVQAERDLNVRISNSLDELKTELLLESTDCILLDIMRPDAVSIEDDIRQVRLLTDAPVVFITGSVFDGLRQKAMKAGAYAVIDKAAMSSAVLKQILSNASCNQAMYRNSRSTEQADETEPEPDDFRPNWDIERIHLILREAQLLLSAVQHKPETVSPVDIAFMEDMLDDLRTFALSDLTDVSFVSLAKCIQEVVPNLNDLIAAQKVHITLVLEQSGSSVMGSPLLAQAGLQRFLAGVIKACQPDDRIRITVSPQRAGMALLRIDVSRKLMDQPQLLFDHVVEPDDIPADAFCSMQAGLFILSVSEGQFSTHSTDLNQTFILNL